jgi:GTP-binding protein
MKFVDEALIIVQSGGGGDGCVSFRREKYVPKGGPDGGDGGKGGNVVLRTTSRMNTLYGFHLNKHFKAQRGAHGRGKNQSGRAGQDMVIEVPPGTVVREGRTGKILKDFTGNEESFVVARGGRGGLGNQHFATPTNRAPRYAQRGETGQTLTLKLELKLLADVGIVGLPNAGKSTLVSRLSAARPKIADYPFTTLIPSLGVAESKGGAPFVVADIPGLIEGAHKGIGLGTRFLKHVERTRILLHLIDGAALLPEDLLHHYWIINKELEAANPGLSGKPQVVVLNKVDKAGVRDLALKAREALAGVNPDTWIISALTGEGVERLKAHLAELVQQAPRVP